MKIKLKYPFTHYYLLTLLLRQICMAFFLLQYNNNDILNNFGNLRWFVSVQ